MKYLFPTLLVVFFLSSCESETDPPAQTGVIFPLAVGNYWVLDNTDYDTSGVAMPEGVDTLTIVSKTTINGEDWYGLMQADGDDTGLCINRIDGFYTLDNGKENLTLKYPCKAGEQYVVDRDTFGTSIRTEYIKVESISSTVIVSAGLFSAIKYLEYSENFDTIANETVRSNSSTTYYAVPNLGIVEVEGHSKTSSGREYLNYELKLKTSFVQ